MDAIIFEGHRKKGSARPSLPIVVASVVSAIMIWVPICLHARRVIWFW